MSNERECCRGTVQNIYLVEKFDKGAENIDQVSVRRPTKSKMADSPGSSGHNRDASGVAKKASSSAVMPSELTRPVHLARISNRKSQLKALPRQKKLEKLAIYSQCKVQSDILSNYYHYNKVVV